MAVMVERQKCEALVMRGTACRTPAKCYKEAHHFTIDHLASSVPTRFSHNS